MGPLGDKSSPKNRKASARPARPGLLWTFWRFVLDHPKGVLIGAATLLGLIVVFQNWRYTRAYLLVTDVSLPFIVWALIFMLVGYLTGKWIEWGWRQRRIRKGTYKPRVSPEALADASAHLDDRLAGREASPDGRGDPGPADAEAPSTIIDRGDRGSGRAQAGAASSAGPWIDPRGGPGASGKAPAADWPQDAPEGRRPAGYSPAAEGAVVGSGPAARHRPPDGRYGDYGDAGRYVDQGAGGRYVDQGGGRYVDQAIGPRYANYGDTGHYVDQGGGGRYVDQGPGRYVDQASGPRYGDYGDYGDAGRPDDPGRRRR